MPAIERLDDGIAVVRMPLPLRVEPVNCYVVGDGDKYVVVDTGLGFHAKEQWSYALRELAIDASDIHTIFITHYHPDHVGGASALAKLTGAPVVASSVTIEQADMVWGTGVEQYFDVLDAFLIEHGMPTELVSELGWERTFVGDAVGLPPEYVRIDNGDRFGRVRTWSVIATPGHADGHICLFDEVSGDLLSGDHLLERISPAVGRYPDHDEDPLGSYLESLVQISELHSKRVLPGHGRPFFDGQQRCHALVRHHEDRLDACIDAIRSAGEPLTAWSIALTVFGEQSTTSDYRFAVTETVAHLAHARVLRKVAMAEATGISAALWRLT
jgi:glyoxylase-like metal-dependent hydrolase (beta-lactamase superfamily II)